MRALTEDQLRAALVNADAEERRLAAMPHDLPLTDWDHQDFFAWRDPRSRGRAYLVVESGGQPVGVLLRAAEGTSRARSAMCNVCHTTQPADQVTLFTARKVGSGGAHGDSVGTYMCADLSCHDNVRIAAPLAPNEIRASVDRRIDGTKSRAEAFVERVCAEEGA